MIWTDAKYCVSQNFYNRYIDCGGTGTRYALLDLTDKLQIV